MFLGARVSGNPHSEALSVDHEGYATGMQKDQCLRMAFRSLTFSVSSCLDYSGDRRAVLRS